MAPALSFVVPLYYSAETIAGVVADIQALSIDGGHEIVLVNDGSLDGTRDVCLDLLRRAPSVAPHVPILFIDHARNFGEHNAVLTGWRHASGDFIVNLDDDGQNPPAEAVRLYEAARDRHLDVVFGHYAEKQHARWRNVVASLVPVWIVFEVA